MALRIRAGWLEEDIAARRVFARHHVICSAGPVPLEEAVLVGLHPGAVLPLDEITERRMMGPSDPIAISFGGWTGGYFHTDKGALS